MKRYILLERGRVKSKEGWTIGKFNNYSKDITKKYYKVEAYEFYYKFVCLPFENNVFKWFKPCYYKWWSFWYYKWQVTWWRRWDRAEHFGESSVCSCSWMFLTPSLRLLKVNFKPVQVDVRLCISDQHIWPGDPQERTIYLLDRGWGKDGIW